MPRGEKVEAVADIKERLESANAVFLAEYAGLSVKDQQVLRRALRSGGAEFRVVKMTLARLAAGQLDIQALDDLLLGPTGIAFANGDVVSAAKALRDFSKDHDVFRIKGGLLGRDYLTPERVAELADIEPHEVLLSRMAAAFQAPMAKFAGLLAALPRGFATAMQQLLEDRQAAEPLQGVGNEGDSDGADDPAPSPDDQASADAETAAAEQEPAAIADAPSADGAPTEDTADADAAAARIPEAPYDGSDGAEDAIGEPAVDGGAGEVASGDGVVEDVVEVSEDDPGRAEDSAGELAVDGADGDETSADHVVEDVSDGSDHGLDRAGDSADELAVDGDDGEVAPPDGVGKDVVEVSDDEPDGVQDAAATPSDEVNDEQSEEAVAKAEEE